MNKINYCTNVLGIFLALIIGSQAYAAEPERMDCTNGKSIETKNIKNAETTKKHCLATTDTAPKSKAKNVKRPDTNRLSSTKEKEVKKSLLLPAVQSAREANEKNRNLNQFKQKPGSVNPASDTTCTGVGSCNDMIATCSALGGNVTPTSYDPDTGSPNGATCFPPGQ